MADKFLVIDGSSLIHRAFFALPPLTTRQGIHTGAVYGLCNMLLKLLDEVKPRYMAVAFDKSRKTFRSKLYAEYKAQRKPTPSELSEQFPLAMKVLECMGIRTLELDDYEADDIIGTLAVQARRRLRLSLLPVTAMSCSLLISVPRFFIPSAASAIFKFLMRRNLLPIMRACSLSSLSS